MASTESPLIRGLREQIVDQLRDEILSGRLTEGAALREIDLARRFGVSRGPIREALLQLTCEGIAIAKPNCGVKVAPSAPDFIHELLIPLRRTVETYALRLFVDTIDDDDYLIWDGILRDMKTACEAKDYVAIAEQDIAFHRSIVRRADQPDLSAIWSTLVARLRRYFRESYHRYNDPMMIYVEHAAIVAAFRTDDKSIALAALEQNIE